MIGSLLQDHTVKHLSVSTARCAIGSAVTIFTEPGICKSIRIRFHPAAESSPVTSSAYKPLKLIFNEMEQRLKNIGTQADIPNEEKTPGAPLRFRVLFCGGRQLIEQDS
jgi:hypothetical protein